MVVLLPYFQGETLVTCTECTHMGIRSSRLERSSFRKRRKNASGYDYHCRKCATTKSEARRDRGDNRIREEELRSARRKQERENITEEKKAAVRAYQLEYYHKRMASTEYRERHAANQRRYREKQKRELGEETLRELRRIDRRCRREREGGSLPTLEEVQQKTAHSRDKLPIEPFREWLRELCRQARIEEGKPDTGRTNEMHNLVAETLHVASRRIHWWLNEQSDSIDPLVVDRAASRHGDITTEQIYWHYGKETSAFVGRLGGYLRIVPRGKLVIYCWEPRERGRVIASNTKQRYCKTQKCIEPAIEGSKWCGACAARLARVRAELENKTSAFQRSIGKKDARPTCCNPACRAPRVRGDRYCFTCQEEGWNEDDLS